MNVKDVVRFGVAVAVAAVFVGQSGVTQGDEQRRSSTTRSAGQRSSLEPGDIHLKASRVYVFVDKTGFGHQHVVAGRLSEGKLRIAEKSAGRMVFDMPSFAADAADARRYLSMEEDVSEKTQREVTETMQGAAILDVADHPTAVFTIDSMRPFEGNSGGAKAQYRIEGQFQLRGVTRPLGFTAEGTLEKGYLHLKGNFPLRQTDYKIRPFRKALGAVGVADVLTVYGDLWIKQ